MLKRAVNAKHSPSATPRGDHVVTACKRGRYSETETRLCRALEIREQALGPEHPDVASSLNNLAVLYHDRGKCADAEPLYQRALEIHAREAAPADASNILENYAELLRETNRTAIACLLEEQAYALRAWQQST